MKGESAMKREEDIGSLINFSFTVSLVPQLKLFVNTDNFLSLNFIRSCEFLLQINNLWKSLEPSVRASLYIHWPKSSKDGKWLLYLVKITSRGPEDVACSPESEINFLKLAQVGNSELVVSHK